MLEKSYAWEDCREDRIKRQRFCSTDSTVQLNYSVFCQWKKVTKKRANVSHLTQVVMAERSQQSQELTILIIITIITVIIVILLLLLLMLVLVFIVMIVSILILVLNLVLFLMFSANTNASFSNKYNVNQYYDIKNDSNNMKSKCEINWNTNNINRFNVTNNFITVIKCMLLLFVLIFTFVVQMKVIFLSFKVVECV